MNEKRKLGEAAVLGAFLCLAFAVLGYFVFQTAASVKESQRTVTVKGLSEKEVPANIAIWPIRFGEVNNDLVSLYATIQEKTALIVAFLKENGFSDAEISQAVPAIADRQADNYESPGKYQYRYAASLAVTVYTDKVDAVRKAMDKIVTLIQRGVVISGQGYQDRPTFLFTNLNGVKPDMVEEATRQARAVAEKFAKDSKSRLGKIKTADQGQFDIEDRDEHTPYIKKIRIVSTIEYYLTD